MSTTELNTTNPNSHFICGSTQKKIYLLLFFFLGITNGYAQPVNDNPFDAIEMDVTGSNKYHNFTNELATNSMVYPDPSCGSYSGADVWFKMTVPGTGAMEIKAKTNIDPQMVLVVYTGSPDNFTEYDCSENGGQGNISSLVTIKDAALAGVEIYVRAFRYGTNIGAPFQISARKGNASSLPVELVNFSSQVLDNEVVVLTWETASEMNNDYFIVEHSTDGSDYTPVGHLAGNGTSFESQYYTYEHDEPYFGENYYRLKQVDVDGQFEYSKTVTAIIKMEEAKINVYPNPVEASRGINIRWIGDFGKEKTQLIITNSAGNQVFLTELDVRHQRESFVDLSTLGLNAGVYYLTINDKNALVANQKINLVRD